MAKFHGAVVVNTERCKGCRLCLHGATGTLYRLPELCNGLPRCLHRGLSRV